MFLPVFRAGPCLLAALLLATPCAFAHGPEHPLPPAAPADDPVSGFVEAFDKAVAAGLPADLAVPVDVHRPRRDVAAAQLVVQDALNIEVDIPGMPAGRMYRGLFGGREAAITRIGTQVDISVPVRDGVDVTGYTAGSPDVLRERVRNPDAPEPGRRPVPRPRDESHVMPGWPFDMDPPLSSEQASLGRGVRAIEDPLAYSPHFFVLIHDDLDARPLHIHSVFAAWWLTELARKILPAENIRMSYRYRIPGVTDMPYGYPEALDNWHETVKAYAELYGLAHGKTYKHKYLLMSRDRPMTDAFGVAFEGGNEAMASTEGRVNIVAHEFGHTLGAEHGLAERRYEGWWWCVTNMATGTDDLIGDCHRFSYDNARRIRSYLRHGPDPEVLAERSFSMILN
ncbi:hypothetical protein [Luteibacter sp. 9133]|uniref:hypothetical protein n=1 Tax=Luteibacter sp. 9133 TaxID=1500891 RepID=UPI00068F8A9E|nr:hypothetical protein [Luteibacter sp. 9133]